MFQQWFQNIPAINCHFHGQVVWMIAYTINDKGRLKSDTICENADFIAMLMII